MTARILCVVATLAASASFADVASNIYTIVVNGGTRAAPVSIEDQQVEIYDAEAGTTTTADFPDVTFKPNSIFRKRGTGYMLSSLGMSSFTGEIRIEEGAFVINTNNQMGVTTSAANAPLIVVSNDASFVMATRSNTCTNKALKIYNRFLIAGNGCDNIGAICNDNETSQLDWLFYGKWTLTDDASVGTVRNSRFDLAIPIDLAGHHLSIRKVTTAATMCLSGGNCIITNSAETVSRVLVDGITLQLQSDMKFIGGAQNELVLTNNTSVATYGFTGNMSHWTMRLCGQHSILPSANSNPAIGALSGNRWLGPVVLDGSNVVAKFSVSSSHDGNGFVLTNKVSGMGRITANNTQLQLGYPTNTFAGSLIAWNDVNRKGGLALWHGQSLPATCAGLWVSNALVTLTTDIERYDLPPTEVYVRANTNIAFTGGSGGNVPSFRKVGPGQLDLSTPFTVTGRAEVVEGTLKLARYAGAGLVSGAVLAPNRSDVNMPDGTHYGDCSTAAYNSTCNLTNRVEISPLCFTGSSANMYKAPAPAEGKVPGVIVMFNGYIWNRSGETQQWTFGGAFGTHTNVKLDNKWLYNYTQYQTGKKATVDVTPGPHRFRVTSYNTGTNSYISAVGGSFTNMAWKIGSAHAGFRYDPEGKDSTACTDYVKIEDPGDGSLLTTTTNDTLTTVYDRPTFQALRLAPGTTLDTFGNGVVVGNLEGLGTITNSNAFFNYPLVVTNSWAASAADVDAGGVLRVHVPLTFAAGATFAAEDLALFPHTDEPLTLCTADAPIEGMPTFDRLANRTTRKWKLFKSDDGRSILFQYRNSISISFR